ncbi:TIGR03885 family FMN-dependent LLM class oxidoreductase [Myceligenerans salitolerans]|uniref:TIGR03885 family FMN-dependent LLM class oxidoreductase n=1 Tax=Myceligenerans salitolerans TaxID=1230528 RepID=A0ABS3IBN6_9MICO|nr:TIGR03885 family FMN-dependent LLM class oxidoreductase [Myceligenerans salitolerans]MBO0610435.1 TIGR03885 family FMN-dependent LLM class oxidoreductase [Myceligenerans salitolerans]
MTVVGFHVSHEQLHPVEGLRVARLAQDAGFDAAMCSDHLAPWSARQGQSPLAWSWLGAALAVTGLSFGTVCAPGRRYHPVVVAQAIATLGAMFPGRFWVALGSGENLNEHVTGDPWPPKAERDGRLEECVQVIRALLLGQEVDHAGLVVAREARLWTLPDVVPPLLCPALTPATARRHAAWADGLITVNQPVGELRRIIEAYREEGGAGDVTVQVHLSWAPTTAEAEAVALDQWRTNTGAPDVVADIPTTRAFDVRSQDVGIEQVRRAVLVSADLGELTAHLAALRDAGADRLYLHHVGRRQDEFVAAFGEHVLPALR